MGAGAQIGTLKVRITIGVWLVGFALAGCASTPVTGTAPAQIVSAVCTRCHSVDRIKAASHDAAGWQSTIARMRGKGAQLTDAQAQQVADFLAGGGASGL
jgi:mono/diheme cytochrome c family protein